MNENQTSTGLKQGASSQLDNEKRILNVACHLFSEYGFQGTGLRDIARNANVNLASIYYYYSNKETLYKAVIQKACVELCDAAGILMEGTVPYSDLDEFRCIIDRLITAMEKDNAWIAKILFLEICHPSGRDILLLKPNMDDCFLPLAKKIRQILNPDTPMDELFFTTVSVISQCLFYSLASNHGRDVSAQVGDFYDDRARFIRHVQEFSIRGMLRNQEGRVRVS